MQSNTTAAQERAAHGRTDPRDDTLLLGIDAEGCHHLLKTERAADRVLVVDDGAVVWVVEDADVEAWVEHITAARGWTPGERRYGSLADCYDTEIATLREGAA